MTSYFQQPDIDPVLLRLVERFTIGSFTFGPIDIRWYSLLYVGGFLVALQILKRLAREKRFLFTPEDMDQFILWLLIGAVAGARIIYCFVYDPKSLMANPLYLFQTWKGGLSFHGGLLGTIVAAIIFSRKKGIPFWNLTDAMALATPTGLAMGRLGNFMNGELFGRVSYVPWAVVFKEGGPEPRHPSQLYEFFLEGVLLFIVLWFLKPRLKRDGQLSVVFLMGYTLSRFIVEFFREPDAHLGYLFLGLSMGQLLSLVMFLATLVTGYLVLWKAPEPEPVKKKKKR